MCLRTARALLALAARAALGDLLGRAALRDLLGRALGTAGTALLASLERGNLGRRNRTTDNRGLATRHGARRGLARQINLETTTERATGLEARLERLLERTGRQDRLRNGTANNLGNLTTPETARRARRGLAVGAGLAAKVAALGLGATDLALRAGLAGLATSTTLNNIDTGRLHLLHMGIAQKILDRKF